MQFSKTSDLTLTAIAVAGLSCAAAYWLLFGAALNQGENNWQVHLAILRLEINRAEAVPLAGDHETSLKEDRDRLIVANKPDKLENYLAKEGWQPSDRFGGTTIFKREKPQEESLYASCGLYSRFYAICDLTSQIIKQP